MELQSVPRGTRSAADYPPPPRVHWFALFAAWVLIVTLAISFTPKPLNRPLAFLAFSPWPIYLSVWMRRLDRESKCLFWVLASIAGEIALCSFPVLHKPGPLLMVLVITVVIALTALPVVTVFVFRAELQRYYNGQEPIGLYLDPLSTFVFSYFYFQYHLYEIAESRRRQPYDVPTGTSGTPVP